MFQGYRVDDKISIRELDKILERSPFEFNAELAELFARFLIENRDRPAVIFNQYMDKQLQEIRIKLDTMISIDYPNDFHSRIKDIKKTLLSVILDI